MKNRYVHGGITLVLFIAMVAFVVALWRGVIPIVWLASLGYEGIFLLSLINGVAPVAGPSQIATFFVASKLNPLAVGMAAGIGGSIGELAGYAFGYSLRAAQSDEVEHKIQRIANWRFLRVSRERSFIPLFVLAGIPNPFFDPVSALAGSLRIGFAQYFIPVLLGKTARHLVIAYAGHYTLSGNLAPVLDKTSMANYLYVGLFVGLVFFIALIVWGIRSFFEEEPDPLLLNFTFFAFAAQCILTVEAYHERIVLGLLAPAVLLLLAQMFVIREQVNKTREHYKKVLRDNSIGSPPTGEIGDWAAILVRITGVDFFPEFYQDWIKFGNPREKRREQAVEVLPRDKFKCEANTGEGFRLESTSKVIPEFPEEALKAGAQGVVVLSLYQDAEGNAANIKVVESPHPAISRAAAAAVSQWKWRKFVSGGIGSPVRSKLSFRFIIEDEAGHVEDLTGGLTPEALLIPGEERQRLWRFYAWICFFSWGFFIICIIAARWNQ
jgi:TonB family protein